MSEPTQTPYVQGPVVYAAASKKSNARNLAGPILLLICLAISLLTVVVVPMVVSGTEPSSSRYTKAASQQVAAPAGVSYETLEQAGADLGFVPAVPVPLPEGMYYSAIQVLDGNVLQMTILSDGQKLTFRTAQGNEDLSGDDTEYGFTLTEEVGGVTRSYAGGDQDTLNLAVWAQDGYSFAVVAEGGADAQLVKTIAESVQ